MGTEWNAEITLRPTTGAGFDQAMVDDLLDLLRAEAPAIAVATDVMTISFGVVAENPGEAFYRAIDLVGGPVAKVVPFEPDLTRVDIERFDELERRVDEPNVPELVGVAEIARILDVTKQRVSELARAEWFPPPLVELAAGPVWARPSIEQFRGKWTRKPGRPKSVT